MPRRRQEEEEEEEVEDEDDQEGGVLEDSGLTEEERRQVRKQQRQLLKDLEEKETEVEEARARNNVIYKKVRYTREAVLDGENVVMIASKASQKIDRLIQVRTNSSVHSMAPYVVTG
jgi:hypothetical protein